MHLTGPSYLFDLMVHLYLSLKKDQGENQQNETKLSLDKKMKLTGFRAMIKCKNLLLHGKKRRFSAIQSMKNIIVSMKSRKHGNA